QRRPAGRCQRSSSSETPSHDHHGVPTMGTTIRQTAMALVLFLVATAGTLPAQEPGCGPLGRLLGRIRHPHGAAAVAPAAFESAPLSSAQAAADCDCSGGSDPYGFAAILNRIRASAGLQPLAYDPELTSWASRNNAVQCRRGIGHHVNPSCVQNCGW